jgi:uncharacterized protein YndB with AHSA1/START domain
MSDNTGKPWSDRREIRTTASPEQAYRAWADPRIVQGWFAEEAEGEARPGGAIIHHFPAFNLSYPMEVVEAEPNRRIVFRMSFPGRPPVTQEVVIRTESGETVIEMTNSGFGGEDWEGQWEGIDSGWKMSFAQLRHYLEHYFGKRRTTSLVVQPAALEWERMLAAYRVPSVLAEWLAEPAAANGTKPLMKEGDDIAIHIRGAGTLSGQVLRTTPREIMFSWRELQGTLELKSFEMEPGNRMVGLRMSTWSEHPPANNVTTEWMQAALTRLIPLVSD